MVKNRATKQAIRSRKESLGEPYSVARNAIVEPSPDQWGWVRNQTHFHAPDDFRLGNFPLNHKMDRHESYAVTGKSTFDYGWHPSIGFFESGDEGIVETKVLALHDEDQTVVVGDHLYRPWTAFLLGANIALGVKKPAPAAFDTLAVYFVAELVTSYWNGDLEPLANLGYAFWKRDGAPGQNLYWGQMQYLITWIGEWFEQNARLTLEMEQEMRLAKRQPDFTGEGIQSLIPIWAELSDEQRSGFARDLFYDVGNIPSIDYIDGEGVVYNSGSQRPPVTPVAMNVGDRVKLAGIGRYMQVRAVSERFVILTFIDSRDNVRYSIIEWEAGVAAPHDSWGYNMGTDEEILDAMAALESGRLQLSWRNRLPLVVQKVAKKR